MSEENTMSDAELADKTGMGEPEHTQREEDNESNSEPDAADSEDEETDEDDDSTDSDNDEEGDEDSDDDDQDEDEDSDNDQTPGSKKQSVPYSRFKTEKSNRQRAEQELSDRRQMTDAITALTQAVSTLQEGKPGQEPKPDEIEAAAKELEGELGMETGLDSTALSKVLRKAVTMAEKKLGNKLPKDVLDKLKDLDDLKKQSQDAKESQHFNEEWSEVEPKLRAKFPNATDAMIGEAREKMDELSHSEGWHKYDLDYILYKNKKTFNTILKAAKSNRSGESGHTIYAPQSDESTAENDLDPTEMTPETVKQMEDRDRRTSAAQGGTRDGIRIVKKV